MNHHFYMLLMLAVAGCGGGLKPAKPDVPDTEALPLVEVFKAEAGDVTDFLEVRGLAEPLRQLSIQTRVSGFIAEHALVEGSVVETGKLLFKMDESELKMADDEAYAAYLAKKQDYEVDVKFRNIPPGDNRQLELIAARTGFRQAEINMERARLNRSFAQFKAPFSGVLSLKKRLEPGQFVTAGTELGILVDVSSIRVVFSVLEKELGLVKPGMTVEVISPSGEKRTGEVISVNPLIDMQTRTGSITAQLQGNGNGIYGGMMVSGRIYIKRIKSRVRVPRSAVLDRDNRQLVFKIVNGQADWIYVKPVHMTRDWAALNEEELSAGDTIAVDRHFAVSHLQKVKPVFGVR
jgi:multidrug efflux pump subunit AcrA (membrane-fusion protein)